MEQTLSLITQLMWQLCDGFTCLSRLHAINALSQQRIPDKLRELALCHRFIECAAQLAQFMQRSYSKKEPPVYWPNALLPTVHTICTQQAVINQSLLIETIAGLQTSLALSINTTLPLIGNTIALKALYTFLQSLAPWLQSDTCTAVPLEEILGENKHCRHGFIKMLSGPAHIPLDPIFQPTDENLHLTADSNDYSLFTHTPYYWTEAADECLSANICALSLVEYDGLPIEFYRDLAKQAYDEIRHAAILLNIAKSLLPNYHDLLDPTDPIHHHITRYATTGAGLPIHVSPNLYEAIWNTTLEERFVLIHYDAEAPKIQRLRQQLSSKLCKRYPMIGNQMEVVMREVITHAKMGDRWLKYLLPNPLERENAIKHARLLRSIFMLSSSAHYEDKPLHTIIHNLITAAN